MILILASHDDAHANRVESVLRRRRVPFVRSARASDDLDVDAITAIWHRRPGRPLFLADLWDSFDGPQIPAPRPVMERAEGTLSNRRIAGDLGFAIPPTLVCPDGGRALRVIVVGDRVFAAEIHSQETMFDYPLPPAEARRCAALTRRVGLCYATIDLVLTPDGRFVFLALDANGEFLPVETMTGMPIAEAVADLLCAASQPARVLRAS